MRILPLAAALVLVHAITAHAATVKVTWGYNSLTGPIHILGPNGTTPIAGADNNGTTGTGYAVELGYYSQATAQNPFAGTWVPVFGKGDANLLFSNASLGDGRTTTDASDIRFGITATVDTDIAGTALNLPPNGQVMAIRYYSSSQSANSAYYGAASNPAWVWVSPSEVPPVPLSYNISQANTVFQDASVAETNERTFTGQPQITTQPAGTISGAGGSAVALTVASTGPGLTYQWYLNGNLITGATDATYNFFLNGLSTGTYTVLITDAYGDQVTGGPYVLSITAPAPSTDTPAMPFIAEILLVVALFIFASQRRLIPARVFSTR